MRLAGALGFTVNQYVNRKSSLLRFCLALRQLPKTLGDRLLWLNETTVELVTNKTDRAGDKEQ